MTPPSATMGRRLLTAVLLAVAPFVMANDPLEPIAEAMNGAAAGLSRADLGESTQAKEQAAAEQLQAIIEQLEQQLKQMQQQGQGQGATANPTKGLDESKIVQGPGGRGAMTTVRDGANDWAKLPDRDRDRIIQAREEGFPPGYEAILERYYRRLAEGAQPQQPKGNSGE